MFRTRRVMTRSIEEALVQSILHLPVPGACPTLGFPEGILCSTAGDLRANSGPVGSSKHPSAIPVSIGSTPVEVRHFGTRAKSVACEHCGHSFEYILRREATVACEDAGQNLAGTTAEVERKLEELLGTGSDTVACPECGGLTSRMRDKITDNRRVGIDLVGLGVVAILIGAGICGVTYLTLKATGELYYVIGLSGIVIFWSGLRLAIRGFSSAVSGKPVEDPLGLKGDSW